MVMGSFTHLRQNFFFHCNWTIV